MRYYLKRHIFGKKTCEVIQCDDCKLRPRVPDTRYGGVYLDNTYMWDTYWYKPFADCLDDAYSIDPYGLQ